MSAATRLGRGKDPSSDGGLETRRGAGARVALEILIVVNTVSFLVASAIHSGFQIPLGFTTLSDVTILPAEIAEGAIGIVFALAAAGVFARMAWAWIGTMAAHAFGILGVLIGLSVTLNDPGDASSANFWFHLIILPVLVVGLVLLLTRSGKAALGRNTTPPKASP